MQTLQRSGRRQFRESDIIISLNSMTSIPMVHKTDGYSTWDLQCRSHGPLDKF